MTTSTDDNSNCNPINRELVSSTAVATVANKVTGDRKGDLEVVTYTAAATTDSSLPAAASTTASRATAVAVAANTTAPLTGSTVFSKNTTARLFPIATYDPNVAQKKKKSPLQTSKRTAKHCKRSSSRSITFHAYDT